MTGKKSLGYLLIILIPLIIVLANLKFLILNKNYYQSLYSKVGVYQNFDSQIATYATDNLFGYFRGQNKLDQNFFSTQAILHLKDVRDLLVYTNGLFYLFLILATFVTIVMFLANKTRYAFQALETAGIITAIVILALSLGLLSSFDNLFLKFHHAFFTNTLWLFPADDNLIKLFPEQFFVEFANHLALNIFISSTTIALVSFLAMKLKIGALKIHWKFKIKN